MMHPNSADEPGLDPALDAHLERLLRADAAREGYIEDAGFTLAVMAALPAPQRHRNYSWLGPALGGLAAAGLVGFSPLAGELLAPLKTALSGHLVTPQGLLVLAPLMALIGCTAWFAASESN